MRNEKLIKVTANLIMVIVLAVLGLLVWQNFLQHSAQAIAAVPSVVVPHLPTNTPAMEVVQVPLSPLSASVNWSYDGGIQRRTDSRTIIPERPIQEVITYTVKRDDTLFGIADSFHVKPETILWGNFDTLQDNPHLLKPDQVLNILPVDGTYYKWKENDNLGAVAAFFGVQPQAILEYPGNDADLTAVNGPNAGLEPGKWIIVPGGKRAIKDWGPPAITRKNAAAASYYGDGSCGAIYDGAIGTGTFIWPTVVRSISGYEYSSIHPAIDIAGATGNAVFASDNGVVVFAGWSNFGYGYLIVIDHGNGYQTAYAHLSAINVGCGQSVFQGSTIGAVGNTGNSAGSHLHFELSYNGVKLNPVENLR
jgi:murein DD-endopeptidase MepM/ murein hydrolase activator NlpD